MFNWLSRRLRKPSAPILAHIPIAGLQYYLAVDLVTLMHKGDMLSLAREPDNPHDPNAVAIYWNGNQIGYIPSENARLLHDMLAEHRKLSGKIVEIDPKAGESRWIKMNIYPQT